MRDTINTGDMKRYIETEDGVTTIRIEKAYEFETEDKDEARAMLPWAMIIAAIQMLHEGAQISSKREHNVVDIMRDMPR